MSDKDKLIRECKWILMLLVAVAVTVCGCGKKVNVTEVAVESSVDSTEIEANEPKAGQNAGDDSGERSNMADNRNSVSGNIEENVTDIKNMDTNDNIGATEMMFADREKTVIDKSDCMVEPILQNPTESTCTVQWFTKGSTKDNYLCLYESRDAQEPYTRIEAKSIKMSRLRGGETEEECNNPNIDADIYKHVAIADNLPQYHGLMSERVYYNVESDGISSGRYTLASAPSKGTPLKILLTSDLQIKSMCAANIEKAYETAGSIDCILCDGDIVDVCDRAYDWFYADNAFFRTFTGTACSEVNGQVYKGAPILQECPIYTAIGNHDVMGVFDNSRDLSVQFNYPSTREQAEKLWESSDKQADKAEFIENHSYNTRTYEEIFELPMNPDGNKRYYAATIGDIRLISLELARVWRLSALGATGKYSELPGTGEDAEFYGFGDFIFEPIAKGSKQYIFLKTELEKSEYSEAKYKLVMFHSEAHSLGTNQIPAYCDPVEKIVADPVTGLPMMTYEYPISEDYIAGLVEPMLESAGTNLLFEAHSHLWNRFVTDSGMHVLESSNVGNSYGAYEDGVKRDLYPSALNEGDVYAAAMDNWRADDYVLEGDPYGLEPIKPTENNLPEGRSYLSSNNITAFSILDTMDGMVRSYYYDTKNNDGNSILFDEFKLY